MFKIMKNHRVGFDKKGNELYEYLVFDCSEQVYSKINKIPKQAIELANMFDMVAVSPIQAKNEGLFEYTETEKVDYPLPL